MILEAKTIDEEVHGIADSYDSMIKPKSIWRNNNNKFYLVFKSIAAGFTTIRNIVLALKYRFDPRFCDDDDLESAMLITGETSIPGKASMLRAIAANMNPEDTALLAAGRYVYTSTSGQPFFFEAQEDVTVAPLGYVAMLFISRDIGAWEVSGETSAGIVREDGQPISEFLEFEVFENYNSLGRLPETPFEKRQRILTDTTRQDTLREMEMALRALPNIFECNLIFNPSDEDDVTIEDGTVLAPKELLVVLTGAPNKDVAEIILSRSVYKTHMNTTEEVLWYYNDLFAIGRYPVYFTTHKKRQFYLTINYVYDRQKMSKENVDAGFTRLLRKYKFMTQHIAEINEPLLYRDVDEHNMSGVELRKIYIQTMIDGSLEAVDKILVPRLMLPELVDITYIAEEL